MKEIDSPVTEENLKHYRFRRVPFGVISSLFLLSATLNLELIGTKTALELGKNLYVDNVILSAKDTIDVLRKYSETKSIFDKAEINIREFSSNDENFNLKMLTREKRKFSVLVGTVKQTLFR